MPNNRVKTAVIQITAAALAVIAAFCVIIYSRRSAEGPVGPDADQTSESLPANDETTAVPVTEADPADSVTDPPETLPPAPDVPDYEKALADFPSTAVVSLEGLSVYKGAYDRSSCKLAIARPDISFPDAYSLRDVPTRKVVREDAGGAAYYYYETTEQAPGRVLTPYFGYLLYDDGTSVKLLDPEGKTLVEDISEYSPVGHRDLSGHPLFKKEDGYFYYYDGTQTTPATVVADRIDPTAALEYPADTFPGAYWNVDDYSEITPSLPEEAGMVECTVDENYFNGVAINSSYETAQTGDIFRFCEHRVIRTVTNQAEIDARSAEIASYRAGVADGTVDPSVPEPQPVEPVISEEDLGFFWGYLDPEGDYILTPQYSRAYEFSEEGLAVISDPEAPDKGRTVVIDRTGAIKINAYKNVFYNIELGNVRVRDGHYLPDTYGAESTGMLSFDHGLALVRRRVILASGGRVLSEENALINTKGGLINVPGGYNIVAYSDGMILLERDGRYGYMDHTGRWIVQPELTFAEPFCEGLAAAGYAEGQIGMIDKEGRTVVPMVFDAVSSCSDGVIAAYSAGNGWTVFNKMSAALFEEPVHPVLKIKKRLLVEKAYKAYTDGDLPQGGESTGEAEPTSPYAQISPAG